MKRKKIFFFVIAVSSLASLTACSSAVAPRSIGSRTESPGKAANSATPPKTAGLPSASAAPEDATPTSDSSAANDTTQLAAMALKLFCRPSLDYQSWIDQLDPVLSQTAAAAYSTVDPANVPCTAITGAPSVQDGDDTYTMEIAIPTDAGMYAVYVHRSEPSSAWSVEQMIPDGSE
jgi:hypothetical protein